MPRLRPLATAIVLLITLGGRAWGAEILEEKKLGVALPKKAKYDEAATLALAKTIADPKISLRIYGLKQTFDEALAHLEKSAGKKPSLRNQREGDEVVDLATWKLAEADLPWKATHWMYVERRTPAPLDPGAKPGKPRVTLSVFRKDWEVPQPQVPVRVEATPTPMASGTAGTPGR